MYRPCQEILNMDICKLEIFIPQTHFKILQEALQKADAGHIGNYDSCLSYSEVVGTWRPLDGSKPYLGQHNQISQEKELKVEVVCKIDNLEKTISAIKNIHPYEEPVINIIPLLSLPHHPTKGK